MYPNRPFIIAAALFFLFATTTVFYSSCIKDKCETVTCYNGGVCVNGTCSCPSGFEGNGCTQVWNSKFTGKWHVDEVALRDTTHQQYDITVTGGNTHDSVYIAGFAKGIVIVQGIRSAYKGFTLVGEQKLTDSITLKSGTVVIDSLTGNVTGLYLYTKKLATKDTLITIDFTWKR